jgi:hypothetical protein
MGNEKSLRQYDLDQVLRVERLRSSQPVCSPGSPFSCNVSI